MCDLPYILKLYVIHAYINKEFKLSIVKKRYQTYLYGYSGGKVTIP